MMKTSRIVLSVGVIAAAVLAGCSRKPSEGKDRVSYTIGAQFGKSLAAQKLELDPKVLARGIEDGLKGKQLDLSEEEMQQAMARLSDQRLQEQKAEAEKHKVVADEFLAKNKNAEGVKVTASGLQYKILNPGTGASPTLEDTVVVNYKGTLVDGTEFDSSYKRNMPAEFPIRGVIPGWTEGLQLMKKGGKAIFYVPPELGYGDRPRQQIPSNAVLIFEVELLDVKPSPKAPGAAMAHMHGSGGGAKKPAAKK